MDAPFLSDATNTSFVASSNDQLHISTHPATPAISNFAEDNSSLQYSQVESEGLSYGCGYDDPNYAAPYDSVASATTIDETGSHFVPSVEHSSRTNSSNAVDGFVLPATGFGDGFAVSGLTESRESSASFTTFLPSVGNIPAVAMQSVIPQETLYVSSGIQSAWIPGERTSGALQAIAALVPASDFLGSDQLTKPQIHSDKLFVNPAFDLALRLVGTIPPSLIPDNPDSMLNNGDIKGLFYKGFYSSAANLAGKLLSSLNQGFGSSAMLVQHSTSSLMLWYYRIASLALFDKVALAAKEMEAFGDLDNPDLYMEYYNSPTSPQLFGSMVPFQFRLLHARLPQLSSGSSKITMERLYALRDTVDRLLSDAEKNILPPGIAAEETKMFIDFWKQRRIAVLLHIISAAVRYEDFDTAISLLGKLMKLIPERMEELAYYLGLLYCYIGSPKMARICFQMREDIVRSCSKDLESVIHFHKALLSICSDTVTHSMEHFNKLLILNPKNAIYANGIAIGQFYGGRMGEAIGFLENLVLTDPKNFLTSQSIQNLVTMYELHNINVRARKLRLLSLICQFIPDGAGVSHLHLEKD